MLFNADGARKEAEVRRANMESQAQFCGHRLCAMIRDVWRAAYMKLSYELTRLPCTDPGKEDPDHLRTCARCKAIDVAHEIKWKAEKRKPRPEQ